MVQPVFDSKSANLVEVTPVHAATQSYNYMCLSRNYSACCTMVWASASWFAILGVVRDAVRLTINCRRCWQHIFNEISQDVWRALSRDKCGKHEIFTKSSSGYNTASSCNRLESRSVNRMLRQIFKFTSEPEHEAVCNVRPNCATTDSKCSTLNFGSFH